jgi:cobalt-zinc-cadmium efflux system protein
MSAVASLGFLFHGASAYVLYKGRKDSVNVYAVFLHTFFDLLSTIVTFVTSIVIHVTGWTIVDSLSSILISVFVLYTGSKLLYKCIKGLFFNGVRLPALKKIEMGLQGLEHIDNVHNLIVKSDSGQVVVGAHIVLKYQCTLEKHDEICRFQIERMLKEKFNVNTSVLQIEASGCKHS